MENYSFGFGSCRRQGRKPSQAVPFIEPDYLPDVVENGSIRIVKSRGHNTPLAGNVRCCNQPDIASEHGQKVREIRYAGTNILLDLESIRHAESDRCGGHQLHESGGALRRYGIGLPTRFHPNDGFDQIHWNGIPTGIVMRPFSRGYSVRLTRT